MKHPTSRLLYAYWNRLRGERSAPERSEIEPGDIRNLLADSMILEVDPALRQASIRLAGTRICALFGRELKGRDFASLWGDASADPWQFVDAVAVDTVGIVAGMRGWTDRDEAVEAELLLLPLRHRGRTQARMLGSLVPAVVPDWLGVRPVVRLDLVSLRVLDKPTRPRDVVELPAPANDPFPVRRGHLMIHQGGRV